MFESLIKELILLGSAEGRKVLLLKELKEIKEARGKVLKKENEVVKALDEALAKELKSL